MLECVKRLALHACCGPCLLEPLDWYRAEAKEVTVVYFNPNIHPAHEYERRRDTLLEYAARQSVEVVELEYDPSVWTDAAGATPDDKGARCRACYRLRLRRVAGWAAENGFDSYATTLTVSPYQDAAVLAEEGELAGIEAGVAYMAKDFRDRYREATRRSRDLGMYRQNYCGCLLSEVEAEHERQERRVARKAAKEDPTV